jgi:hypothetical protein
MADAAVFAMAIWQLALRELLIIIAIGMLLPGLDDLFINTVYFSRRLWRRQTVYRLHADRSGHPARLSVLTGVYRAVSQ